MLTSPGNCYGVKKGDRCYSNLQVLVGNLAREGPNTAPHWQLLEDAFPGFLAAYIQRGIDRCGLENEG